MEPSTLFVDSAWFGPLELAGVFVFAISGAVAGVRHRLDPFGVLVVSFVTACGGGLLRDVLLGDLPPAVMSNWRYLAVTMSAGLLTFYGFRFVNRLDHPFLLFDAIGLGFFTIVGTTKALDFQVEPLWAIVFGMITGIGGGVLRDIILNQTPLVLRADVYALPAILGAAVMVVGTRLLAFPSMVSAMVGALLCIVFRLLAIRYRWRIDPAKIDETD